jgi:hypothetical protein
MGALTLNNRIAMAPPWPSSTPPPSTAATPTPTLIIRL